MADVLQRGAGRPGLQIVALDRRQQQRFQVSVDQEDFVGPAIAVVRDFLKCDLESGGRNLRHSCRGMSEKESQGQQNFKSAEFPIWFFRELSRTERANGLSVFVKSM